MTASIVATVMAYPQLAAALVAGVCLAWVMVSGK